jgi:multiple antibiotic resistance protein
MTNEYLLYFLTSLAAFFAIMNPFSKLPIFLGMVEGYPSEDKIRVARVSLIVAFSIVFFFILFGRGVFYIFHLSIPGFKVAGGLLLFYIGFEMLLSKRSDIHAENHEVKFNMDHAISPLAIPILAGPGAIVTAM